MSELNNRNGLMRQPAFWIAIAAVTIVAFALGALLSGGKSAAPEIGTAAETSKEPQVWTCSMHPQIKLPKEGKCPICFMDLIPLTTDGGEDLGPRQLRMSESSRQLAQIATSPVTRGTAQNELRLYGKLAADETKLFRITARVGGRIDRLYINTTGQLVRRGEKMLELYSPELLSAQKELIAAKASLKSVAESNSEILKSTSEATVRAATEKLRLFGFSDEQIANVESQADVTEHISVMAPGGGTVIEKMVVEGQYVEPGMDLFRIADLSRLWAVFEAYESDLALLKTGDEINFVTQSVPGEEFSAKVSFVSPTIDPMSRTVQVRTVVDNGGGRLKPDMFVTATTKSAISTRTDVTDNSLLVPASAVLFTGKRAVVYLQLPSEVGPLFEGREVTLGSRINDHYVVLEGLTEGDMVVTNGAFKLDSELQIQAKPSMMSPEGGAAPASHDHSSGAKEPAAMNDALTVSESARNALAPLYNDYFKFQMALAADDISAAKQSSAQLAKTISNIDMSLFSGAAHNRWMDLSQQMQEFSEKAANAEDIEGARDAFFYLSKAVIELQSAFGHGSDMNYYLTFCPMARDNKGAYWLQTVDTVYNSFYGAMMLRCGETKQTLKAVN